MEKKKTINVLTIFLISYKSDIKTFIKQIVLKVLVNMILKILINMLFQKCFDITFMKNIKKKNC